MRILVTGATGFIGRHVTASLVAAGHEVLIGARNETLAIRLFPDCTVVTCDFVKDVTANAWRPRLGNLDAVVNCVGVLQPRRPEIAEAIHVRATSALFDACSEAGVKRVIHISALGVDSGIGLTYATSKLAADEHLQSLDVDWTILRPSLVYTPSGSYGGTSLFRAQAALPFVIPLPGRGDQLFQPVFMGDLTEGIRRLLEERKGICEIIPVTGPEPVPLREILRQLRGWLGLGRAWLLRIPMPVMWLLVRLGDLVSGGSLTTTALRMIDQGNAAEPDHFTRVSGIQPRRFADVLGEHPAHVQDRWHARLYFLRPLLRVGLALFWLLAGLSLLGPFLLVHSILSHSGSLNVPVVMFAALMVLSGLCLLASWRPRLMLAIQLLALLGLGSYWLPLSLAALDELSWLTVLFRATIVTATLLLGVATLVALALEDER